MTTEHKLLLSTLIAKSQLLSGQLKDEVEILERCGLYEEARRKARLRVTHIKRILRFKNALIQDEA